jgi:phospholipid transport system substrate-binding protein
MTGAIRTALAGFILFAMTAGPAVAAEEPRAMIERLGGEAIRLVADDQSTAAQKKAGFEALFQDGFDVPLVARIVLGRYWRAATVEQQQEYVELFHSYIVDTYAARLNAYSGQTFEVTGQQPLSEDEVLVKSVIRQPEGPTLKVDWRVLSRGGESRIVDVVVEGVSMAITHRSEFAAVISKTGQVETLLQRLRAQTGAG